MYKAYKYRIYPTDAQKVLLEKHFGCVRFVYNLALETKIEAYKKGVTLSVFDLQKQMTELKNDCEWLREVSSYALEASIANMGNAYKNFFKGGNYPIFKKKTNSVSFTVRNHTHLIGNKLLIPKFKEGIKAVFHNKLEGDIRKTTISKTPTGKYYASILVQTDCSELPVNTNTVGIDLGIKTFAVLSDGKQFESPKFLRKSLGRLAVLQRRASRKKKGSANRKKANLRVALLHERINNQRKDFLHKTSNQITNDYGIICIEDLNISGMVKNHNLALSISDAGWYKLTEMLGYKSEWKGRHLIKVDRFEPTSKTCSGCGSVKPMPLSERVYSCECGLSIDRDVNAAINIKNSGLLRAVAPVELISMDRAVKQEKFRQSHNHQLISLTHPFKVKPGDNTNDYERDRK